MVLSQVNYSISGEEGTDVRLTWALMSSPVPLICISLVYLFIVYLIGPRYMRYRKPYALKTYMQCYNVFQVIINFWTVYIVTSNFIYTTSSNLTILFRVVWDFCDNKYSYDISNPKSVKLCEIIWWLLILKLIDLSETVVFVLRKRQNQISFLHVYHHISTVFYVWITMKYFFHIILLCQIFANCSTHVIMYSYYFLSTCGPEMQRKLHPFKKWITIIQMVQIIYIALPSLNVFNFFCDNNWRYYCVILLLNGIMNILLFNNFYTMSYKKQKTI